MVTTFSANGPRQDGTINYEILTKWETKPTTNPRRLLEF